MGWKGGVMAGAKRVRSAVALTVGVVFAATTAVPSGAYPRPGRTERVSVTSDGKRSAGVDVSDAPSISASGRFISFSSAAPDLIVPDLNPQGRDTFVYDRSSRDIELVSISSTGTQGKTLPAPLEWVNATKPSMSANGRYVAFTSTAANLVSRDTNQCSHGYNPQDSLVGPCADVFVHDRLTRVTERVSVSSSGTQGNDASLRPSISDDGRHVVFTSFASNLVKNDKNARSDTNPNGGQDVFLHDRRKGTTSLVSVSTKGEQGTGDSTCGYLDATGRFVVLSSFADNLAPDDTDSGGVDVFVRDLKKGRTELVSVASDGEQSSGFCGETTGLEAGLDISKGGRYVAFASRDGNLVPADTHDSIGYNMDVFVHDRRTSRIERVSVTSYGGQTVDGHSGRVSISDDGRFVAFESTAKNLFPDDAEQPVPRLLGGDDDAFVHDRRTGVTNLLSVDAKGQDGQCTGQLWGAAWYPTLSANGRYASFSSCDAHLARADDPGNASNAWQVYVRDLGPILGTGGLGAGGDANDPEDRICITPDTCVPPGGVTTRKDKPDRIPPLHKHEGADLYGLSIASRSREDQELFVRIQLEHLPSVVGGPASAATTGSPAILYGLRFQLKGSRYEVRVHRGLSVSTEAPGAGSLGLFRCSDYKDGCEHVAELRGSYGTTGEEVVFSLPLEAVHLDAGGKLSNVKAFTAIGGFSTGALKVLDTLRFR